MPELHKALNACPWPGFNLAAVYDDQLFQSEFGSDNQELSAGTFSALIIGLFVGHPPVIRGIASALNFSLISYDPNCETCTVCHTMAHTHK